MVDWQNPVTIFNELGSSSVPFSSHFTNFFPPPHPSSKPLMTGRCIDQARACHRRNLSVRPSFSSMWRYATPHRSKLTAIISSIHAIISWEFICNLGFESSLLRSRRQWRWTAAVSRPVLPHPSHHAFFVNSRRGGCFFFFPTALHRLSVFHHLPGRNGPHRFEYDKPIQLQGTPFSCPSLPFQTCHVGSPTPVPTGLVDLLSRMCLAASISAPVVM